jgi:hypothetical protein
VTAEPMENQAGEDIVTVGMPPRAGTSATTENTAPARNQGKLTEAITAGSTSAAETTGTSLTSKQQNGCHQKRTTKNVAGTLTTGGC